MLCHGVGHFFTKKMSSRANSDTQKQLKPVFYNALEQLLPTVLIKEAFDYISIDVAVVPIPECDKLSIPNAAHYIQWKGQIVDGDTNINGIHIDIPQHFILTEKEDGLNRDEFRHVEYYPWAFKYSIPTWPVHLSCIGGIDNLIKGIENRICSLFSTWDMKDEYKDQVLQELRAIKHILDSDHSIFNGKFG